MKSFTLEISKGMRQLRSFLHRLMKHHRTEALLGVIIFLFVAVFSGIVVHRYYYGGSHYYDLGIMNQVVYNTSRGRFLEMTNPEFNENMSRFAIHFDPILALFAPFYLIYSSPIILLVGQVIIVSLGALAVYLLALFYTKSKSVGVVFSVIYLAYFPIQRSLLFDFHAVTLAIPLLLFAIYYALINKKSLSLFLIVLALLTKEHVGLVTGLLGLYFLIVKKEYRFGLTVFCVSIFFFFTSFFYIIPAFRTEDHFALKYVVHNEGSLNVGSILKNPLSFASSVVSGERGRYLLMLLGPQLMFIVLAPLEFFPGLAELGINVISSNQNMRSYYFHYNSLIIVFVMWSMIVGFVRLRKYIKRDVDRTLYYMLFGAFFLVQFYFCSPFPYGLVQDPYSPPLMSEQKRKSITTWVDRLNQDETKVAATPHLAPFFTTRRYYVNFLFDPAYSDMGTQESDIIGKLEKYEHAQYVVIDDVEIHFENPNDMTYRYYLHLQMNANYERIYDQNGIEVFKKKA